MMTVHEVQAACGVSIRTLHHYDAIGLLKPTAYTESGYRLYDESALSRLQSILLFRELEFPLSEIRRILDSPAYSPMDALDDQIALLLLRRQRLDELISLARQIRKTGGRTMQFTAFGTDEIDKYRKEAEARWGNTAAWKESEEKAEAYDAARQSNDLAECFARLGALRTQDPACDAVQEAVEALRRCISDHYYSCTKEILSGLGEMYVQDARFRESIDSAGGSGTAVFAAKAIALFCEKDT